MDELKQQVADLIAEAHQLTNATRTRIRLFISVLVLVAVALAGFGSTALQARSAARKAQAALVATCEAGNTFRRLDQARWFYILDLSAKSPPPRGESPSQARARRARTRQFRAFIIAADKPRVCKT